MFRTALFLERTVDTANHRQGHNKVVMVLQGFEPLKMNRTYLSPDWRNIIMVKV